VWIDYLRNGRSPLADVVERLIDTGELALIGIVFAELLRGTRAESDRLRLEEQLQGAPFVEMSLATWRRAGVLWSGLDSQGQVIPLSDILIGALALEGDHEVLTRDKHFERIPGLRLYKPEGEIV